MEIRWLEDALADLTEIHPFAADNPRVTARVVERIRAAIRHLAELPHRGRPGRWPGTRELIIPGAPYILPYRVKAKPLRSCASLTAPAAGRISRWGSETLIWCFVEDRRLLVDISAGGSLNASRHS
jgi:toxin ParE1/3/4